MNKEEFKVKAMEVLSGQTFGDMPLFESDFIEDFEIGDGSSSMELELFLDHFYEVLND